MSTLLQVEHLEAGYGDTVILEDIDFSLAGGEVLSILGRNGVGKSTLVETLMGFTRLHAGRISLAGQAIHNWPTHQRNALGLGYVPQEREVFPSLTVEENLRVARRERGWRVADVYEFFPSLAHRKTALGNTLSGGEQQMLSIGRALMGGPRVLILDEPMEGLAPIVVETLYEGLVRLRDSAQMSMVLIEQHAELALSIADHALVLDRGRIVHRATGAALLANRGLRENLLGVVRNA